MPRTHLAQWQQVLWMIYVCIVDKKKQQKHIKKKLEAGTVVNIRLKPLERMLNHSPIGLTDRNLINT